MSKKKKKQKAKDIQAVKQEIPIQDDPYWKASSIHMDAHRVGRYLARFERFEYLHPEWTGDLMDGIPTYYCVLGVEKGATSDEIENAYNKKLSFSSYPDEVIEEAFDVLSDARLQKEYNELLFIFEQITKCMPYMEKNELIEKHSTHLNSEKEYTRMEQILHNYKGYHILYMNGMPDLYEIAGHAKDSTFEEIKKYSETGSELLKKTCTILGDPASREDYDFLIYFTNKYADQKSLEKREVRRKKWGEIDKGFSEKMILTVLNEPDAIEKYMLRRGEILNSNQDWKHYIPPNKETFLSMLGLDKNSICGDKKEIEKTIREKYRQLEKTAQVNLAYSVLKNTSLRDDYLWLLENHEMLDTLVNLLSEREEVPLLRQTTFDDIF